MRTLVGAAEPDEPPRVPGFEFSLERSGDGWWSLPAAMRWPTGTTGTGNATVVYVTTTTSTR